MRKIREVLRLKFEQNRGHREIAASCGIGVATVSEYLRRARDSGPELPKILDALGISRYIARTFNSAATGVEKPNPEAFRQVLQLVPSGSRVWMVGDSVNADVLGAKAVGVNAILARGEHPRATRCCRSLSDVLMFLADE